VRHFKQSHVKTAACNCLKRPIFEATTSFFGLARTPSQVFQVANLIVTRSLTSRSSIIMRVFVSVSWHVSAALMGFSLRDNKRSTYSIRRVVGPTLEGGNVTASTSLRILSCYMAFGLPSTFGLRMPAIQYGWTVQGGVHYNTEGPSTKKAWARST
jgi:hypothetical protein